MLIDLHAHSSSVSVCCKANLDAVFEKAKQVGLDGVVLTNHYVKNYAKDGDFKSLARKYMEEWDKAQRRAEDIGSKVFFGIEVTMELYIKVHLLIYGVSEDFLEKHLTLFDMTQEEIYSTVKENGGVLVQAHPFRKNIDRLLDTKYLDGIEISCHPLYESTHLDRLSEIAYRDGLILTCGGDYHADTHRPKCGMYLPDSIENSIDLGKYLVTVDSVKLCVQEVDSRDTHDVIFTRSKDIRQ